MIRLLPLLLLASCTTSPTVTRKPDGTYIAHAGGTFMASRAGVIAHIKTREGDEIKFASKSEDTTKVPIAIGRQAVSALLGWMGFAADKAQTASEEAVALGAQQADVTKFAEGQVTERAAIEAGKAVDLAKLAQ